RAETDKIAVPNSRTASAMIGPIEFGRTWRIRLRYQRDPMDRGASTWAAWQTRRLWDRAMRAKVAMDPMATAMATLVEPNPRAEMRANESNRAGIARSTSTTRITVWSTQPPKNPAMSPNSPPDTRAMVTAISAVRKDRAVRSEEHTSELQSRFDIVCRLLLAKKK